MLGSCMSSRVQLHRYVPHNGVRAARTCQLHNCRVSYPVLSRLTPCRAGVENIGTEDDEATSSAATAQKRMAAAAASTNGTATKAAAAPAAATIAEAAAGDGAAVGPDASPDEAAPDADATSKSDAYSENMNRQMGTSLTYRHELGIDYNRIWDDVIVGSCLQTPADVDLLAEKEGVTTVFCLQEDCDMAYFNLDVEPIQQRCMERGDIKHVRFPIRDFDPYDLRRKLPKAVARLAREHDPRRGTVYIHCTAGMGRAPATALAYMAWVRGEQLDEAYAKLTTTRRCGPKIEAIRSATADLLLGTQPIMTTIAVHRYGDAKQIQVAGLDVGWHKPLDMVRDPGSHRFVLNRKLYPGKYQYKLIVDGHWTYSADHPTSKDGDHINNTLEVIPAAMDSITIAKQMKYLTAGSVLSEDEKAELRSMLCPWATHDGSGRPPWEVDPGLSPDQLLNDLSDAQTD